MHPEVLEEGLGHPAGKRPPRQVGPRSDRAPGEQGQQQRPPADAQSAARRNQPEGTLDPERPVATHQRECVDAVSRLVAGRGGHLSSLPTTPSSIAEHLVEWHEN